MYINFSGVDLTLKRRKIIFDWERFSLESFQNDTSLSFSTHTHTHTTILTTRNRETFKHLEG